jgi:hypothetical protein
MTFSEFLHILTTSRYTRKLEEENTELKSLRAEVAMLRADRDRILKRLLGAPQSMTQGSVDGDDMGRGSGSPSMIQQRGRPGRFKSFGAAKRELESQDPPQRSVNV